MSFIKKYIFGTFRDPWSCDLQLLERLRPTRIFQVSLVQSELRPSPEPPTLPHLSPPSADQQSSLEVIMGEAAQHLLKYLVRQHLGQLVSIIHCVLLFHPCSLLSDTVLFWRVTGEYYFHLVENLQ